MKRCPDCTETVRSEARKCQFCGLRFDAPPASSLPGWLAAVGALVTVAGGITVALGITKIVIVIGALVLAAGTLPLGLHRRATRRRCCASCAIVPAGITTLRGHAR